MAKWADYAITAVRYDSNHTFITYCHVRADNGDALQSIPEVLSRQTVIQNIKRSTTYVTAVLDANNKWQKGAEVGVININGIDYLRTDKNRTPKDNLENLPEF